MDFFVMSDGTNDEGLAPHIQERVTERTGEPKVDAPVVVSFNPGTNRTSCQRDTRAHCGAHMLNRVSRRMCERHVF